MHDHITTLTQRRDYLSFRIEAKEKCGWDTSYDRRERDALTWALSELSLLEVMSRTVRLLEIVNKNNLIHRDAAD